MKNIALILVITLSISSCAFEEDVIFKKIDNVKLAGVSDGQLVLNAEAFFDNPNNISGKLKSIELEVKLRDKVLAHISQSEKFTIEKNSSFIIPFDASFAMEDIQDGFFENLISIVSGKKLKLQFVGEIKVSTWGFSQKIPVDYYVEVKL